MAYADYEFYRSIYCGNVIPSEDFPRVALRASDILDHITFDRITAGVLNEFSLKIRKTCCELAEAIYSEELTLTKKMAMGGADVTSVSSGSESISFGNANATSSEIKARQYYNIAKKYLSGTGLLYAGM